MKLASLLLAGAVLLPPAQAKPKIATLDVRKAVQSTREGKLAIAELERKFRPEFDKLAEQNSEIEKLRSQLADRDDYASLKARIGAMGDRYNRDQDDLRHKIEEEERRVINELGPKLLLVAEKYAKQKHFEVIMDESEPKAAIIWRADKNDITDQVIKLYDLPAKKP
jgi:Skp family chaperone for outer membrane proteins